MTSLLKIEDLSIDYRNPLRQGRAVNGLTFDIKAGESLALVGESGCGKSTTALSILRLLPPETGISGRIDFEGQNLATMPERELRQIRGRHIGMIFQEPLTSLNPVYRIGRQITEVLRRHLEISSSEARARALELLDMVALPDAKRRIDAYPHELSGGQRQRVMIAMAIALRPKLLIADEPTTALDATVQSQILGLIDSLRRELGMAVLMISHDLPVVSRWSERVIVMHHGEKMEELQAAKIFEAASHPYTRGLIGASLRMEDQLHYSHRPLSEIEARQHPQNGTWDFTLSKKRLKVVGGQDVSGPVSPQATEGHPVLTLEGVSIDYGQAAARFRAVSDVSFTLKRGQTLGLVGESGSGKSSISRAILGLVSPSEGRILLGDERIDGLSLKALRPYRKRVQMVFQDPYSSLNPRKDVATILGSVLKANGVSAAVERDRRIREALDQVGLPLASLTRRPHEFSGGQRQRIAIARALILRPEVLICDEPVSALDVSVQAQILNLLVELKQELGLSYLFVSHDLSVVRYISDEVMVMQQGKIVEQAQVAQLWADPQHHYTKQLLLSA